MTCEFFRLPDGTRVILCCRGRLPKKTPPCVGCGKPSTLLCDYPLRGKKAGKTCSRPICDACATRVPGVMTSEHDSVDLCPQHKDAASDMFFGDHAGIVRTPPQHFDVKLNIRRKGATEPTGDDAA